MADRFAQCGGSWYSGPMVKNEIWRKICNNDFQDRKKVFCYRCMEARLGQEITFKDLKICGWNELVMFGFLMAVRSMMMEGKPEMLRVIQDYFDHANEEVRRIAKENEPKNKRMIMEVLARKAAKVS